MEAKQSVDKLEASSTLRIIDLDPQTDPRWEALVTNIPTCWMYYHPAWLKIEEEAYGYKPAHLACEDISSGQLVGILPLFYRRGCRSGRSLRSGFIGPFAYDDRAKAALLQGAIERTRAKPDVQLHITVISNALDSLVGDVVGIPAHETYLLALQSNALPVDSSIKRAVKKAAREGVEVRRAETEDELRAWYDLYVRTVRKFSVLPRPYLYYKLAWQRLHSQGLIRLLLAEHVEAGRRKLVGGIFLLLFNQTVSFDTGGWREEDQALRPNDVLHWQAIQDASAEGFRWYDFGDVELGNHGLARYKSKWGAEAKMVYNYSYPASIHQSSSLAHDLSSNHARQLAQAVWQHLPTKAIGLLSDWYYTLHLY